VQQVRKAVFPTFGLLEAEGQIQISHRVDMARVDRAANLAHGKMS